MKKEKIMLIATMAILTLVGSVLTACSSDDDIAPSTVDTASAWIALQSCMSELDGISTRDEAIKALAKIIALVRRAGCTTVEAQSIASDFKSAIAKLNGAKATEPITSDDLEYSNYKRLAVSLKSLSSQGTGYTTIDKIVELIGFAADDVQVNSEQSGMLAELDELTAAELKSDGYYGDELTKQEKKFFEAYAEILRAKYDLTYATDKVKWATKLGQSL